MCWRLCWFHVEWCWRERARLPTYLQPKSKPKESCFALPVIFSALCVQNYLLTHCLLSMHVVSHCTELFFTQKGLFMLVHEFFSNVNTLQIIIRLFTHVGRSPLSLSSEFRLIRSPARGEFRFILNKVKVCSPYVHFYTFKVMKFLLHSLHIEIFCLADLTKTKQNKLFCLDHSSWKMIFFLDRWAF